MNRKQRLFSNIGRLMRSHRHMGSPARGLRFKDGDAEGGGGAATLEYPKIEVPSSFSFKDPAKDVPDALNKIAATMTDLEGRGKLTSEAFKKITDDIGEIRKAASEARETARNLIRDVPGPHEANGPLRLSRIPLSLHVRGESDTDFLPDFSKFERAGRPGLVQYNLLTRTDAELGITDPGDIVQLRRLKALHDATVMMNLAHSHDAAYFSNGGHKQLPWWDEQVKLAKKFIGALSDATAGEGLEWIQVNLLSSTIQELIELDLEYSRLFQIFPMRAPTVKWPVMAAHSRMKFTGENVNSDGSGTAVITPTSWTTSDKTYTARKGTAGVVLSSEWEEDAVVNAPLYAQSELAQLLARGREEAIINAQRGAITGTASTQDGGTIPVDDPLAMWDGIRRFFRLTGKPSTDLGAGITAEALASMFGGQGAPGSKVRDCAWLTGTAGLARLMVAKAGDNSPLFLTLDKAGNSFALQTGAIGMVFGRPVYVSEFVSEKMQSDGTLDDYFTPTGNKTAIYHMYHRCMKIGQRRGILIGRSDDTRFWQDQIAFKATSREDFQSNVTPSSTAPLVMEGNNLATF